LAYIESPGNKPGSGEARGIRLFSGDSDSASMPTQIKLAIRVLPCIFHAQSGGV